MSYAVDKRERQVGNKASLTGHDTGSGRTMTRYDDTDPLSMHPIFLVVHNPHSSCPVHAEAN